MPLALAMLVVAGSGCGSSPTEEQGTARSRPDAAAADRQAVSLVRTLTDPVCHGYQVVNTTYRHIPGTSGRGSGMVLEVTSDVTRKDCQESVTTPLLQFVANEAVRHVAALQDGPSSPIDSTVWRPNTAVIVQYGDGSTTPQRIVIPGDPDAEYGIQSLTLDAPAPLETRYGIEVVGKSKDTVAVSGVVIHLRYGQKNTSTSRDVLIPIENDRMIAPR
jgi:hypothetical protein